jgi:hypothetical protein
MLLLLFFPCHSNSSTQLSVNSLTLSLNLTAHGSRYIAEKQIVTDALPSDEHGAALHGKAWRKHRFPYCCVIAALTDLRVSTALAWCKYATLF